MARDQTPLEEIESILYACGVKESGAVAEQVYAASKAPELQHEIDRYQHLRPYLAGFADALRKGEQ